MSVLSRVPCRVFSSLPERVVKTDSCGIPRRPTWSVNDLLSSYPTPSLTPEMLKHLHELSALIPPKEDTPEYGRLKTELEDLVRLVEAVKMVNTENVLAYRIEDPGRLTTAIDREQEKHPDGRSLLKHAARARDGFYVVDADKPQ
ncbi:hypothetical protein DFH07DRAFT_1057054 [Mycena maculata]|uniref:Uncharacterized protein n=1 Tax=Mycena maculata TaxID=230809 RepID=A0AAD7JY25_9AGAR|nr:hypothetical protein DFH07DRAFT_1057054 [Mycena maculata]